MLTRDQLKEKLEQAFSVEQVSILVDVLDQLRQMELERAAATQELKQGLTELTGEVRKLTEAQQRTDERLAAFQQRTDERFVELAEAQRRTEDNLIRLTQVVEKLAQGQEELRQEVGQVRKGLSDLRQDVGNLSHRLGYDFEEFVAALLPPYLEKHQGITNLVLEPRYLDLGDGRMEEVDLAGTGHQNGQSVLVLVECRTRIFRGETRKLANKLKVIQVALGNVETLLVIVAMRIHPTAQEVAEEEGILLVPYSRINRPGDWA